MQFKKYKDNDDKKQTIFVFSCSSGSGLGILSKKTNRMVKGRGYKWMTNTVDNTSAKLSAPK